MASLPPPARPASPPRGGSSTEMRPAGTVAVILLKALLECAERCGVSGDRVLQAIGVSSWQLDDAAGWIPVETLTRAWTLVPALCGDPDFGLHAAESAPTGVYGFFEFAVTSSPTVFDALESITRMYRLVGGMSEVTLRSDGDSVSFIHRTTVAVEPNRLRHYSEHFLAMIASRGRELAEQDVSPRVVYFAHDSPVSTEEHRRIFQAPVFFSQPYNELVIDRALLDVPLRGSPTARRLRVAESR